MHGIPVFLTLYKNMKGTEHITFPWGHKRRFNAYSNYFKKSVGERVQKVSINAGFTCPNRDGTLGTTGCSYCNNRAFSPSYCNPSTSVKGQIETGMAFHKNRYRKAGKYLAYFQAFSNTYAPLKKLRKIYEEALTVPGIVGLVIGTRPDCVDKEKLDYFAELAKKTHLIIEYGIESCYDKTLERINRGHTYQTAVDAIQKTAERGIKSGAHIIFGLPGESRDQMLAEAETLSRLPLDNIKFHQLQIIRGTPMEKEYQDDPSAFHLFTMQEYLDFFVSFIERLNPAFVVERFVGEAPPDFHAGPRWKEKLRNEQIIALFEQKLEEQDTWQGKYWIGTGDQISKIRKQEAGNR